MFAAISSTAISVYGTYTCALIATLRGHADKVVSFVWTRDDRHIVSIGKDGLVVRFAVVVPNASSAAAAALAAAGPGGSAGAWLPPRPLLVLSARISLSLYASQLRALRAVARL